MPPKPLDADLIAKLLGGKRSLTDKLPKAENTPVTFDFEKERPDWHRWVYGGQRNPTI